MISFSLPDEHAKVTAVRIHGSRYGMPQPPKESFLVFFLNADANEVVATRTVPYERFERGREDWVEIKFPQPIEVPKDFWIALDFRAGRTKGIYVSVDESTSGEHSRVGLPGLEPSPASFKGDWMIDMVVAR